MDLKLPKSVTVRDLVVRDGFQHEEHFIPTETKVYLVNALAEAGFRRLEVTNLANPRYLPQFRDADDVLKQIQRKPGVEYTAVTISETAVKRAVRAREEGWGPDRILCLISTSEAHSLRETGMPHDQAWPRFETWVRMAHQAGMKMCICVSTIWGCPIQGPVPMERAVEFTTRALGIGADDIEHADHDGSATPDKVYRYFSMVLDKHPDPALHVAHFHVTRGWGLANVLAAMQAGVACFESTLGGIGGQPATVVDRVPVRGVGAYYYSDPNITGLVSTEDLIVMLDEMGIETGVDVDKVLGLGKLVEKVLGRPLRSESVHTGRIPKKPTGF